MTFYHIARRRTEEERKRRHIHGDHGAKFASKLPTLGSTQVFASLTTFYNKDLLLAVVNDNPKIRNNDINMKQDLHHHVRLIYRCFRRQLGIEKAQEESLRVFMVVFPEIPKCKAAEDTLFRLPEDKVKQLETIISDWQPQGHLADLCTIVLEECKKLRKKDDYIQFLEDITPVAMAIRKLTPRECFRLMDVEEQDIDTLQSSGLSDTSQYKLAGNSIVVACMVGIFKNWFVDTAPQHKPGEQLTLNLF